MNYKEEYKKCAEKCRDTDYGNKKSARKHNETVDHMYKIFEQASHVGNETISELISLLDDEVTSRGISRLIVFEIAIMFLLMMLGYLNVICIAITETETNAPLAEVL